MRHSNHVVAIIGGGLTGAVLASLLLSTRSASIELHLVEPLPGPAREPPHGDAGLSLLLNVPAGRMSLYADGPNDFARWARLHGPRLGWPQAASANSASYLPRALYDRYVRSALQDAADWAAADRPTPLIRHAGRLRQAALAADGRLRLEFDDGCAILADTVVLAPALRAPSIPFPVDGEGGRFIADARTKDALAALARDDRVLVVGTGLMMVDVIASLDRSRHCGQITAVSAHGLLPRVRGVSEHQPQVLTEADMRRGIRHAVRTLRTAIAEGKADWRAAIDSLRPNLHVLFAALPPGDQDRLLRHLRPFWEVHRHRMAAESADQLLRWTASGQLRIVAGRVVRVAQHTTGVDAVVVARGSNTSERWPVDWVINCTAPAPLFSAPHDALAETLLKAGLARPNRSGEGFDKASDDRVIDAAGHPVDNLFVVGQARRGHVFEEAQIPTFRPQLEALAAHLTRLASSHPKRRRA